MDYEKIKKEMRNEVRRLALDPQFLRALSEAMKPVVKKQKRKKDEKTQELFL